MRFGHRFSWRILFSFGSKFMCRVNFAHSEGIDSAAQMIKSMMTRTVYFNYFLDEMGINLWMSSYIRKKDLKRLRRLIRLSGQFFFEGLWKKTECRGVRFAPSAGFARLCPCIRADTHTEGEGWIQSKRSSYFSLSRLPLRHSSHRDARAASSATLQLPAGTEFAAPAAASRFSM